MRISDWSSDVCSSDLPQTASVGEVQHGAIPGAQARLRIGCIEQRGDLVPRQIVDQGRVGPLCRHGTYTQREIEAGWDAILDVTEERPDRRKPGIAGYGTVLPCLLRMVEKRHDQRGIEILNRQVGGEQLQVVGCETDQKREAVREG